MENNINKNIKLSKVGTRPTEQEIKNHTINSNKIVERRVDPYMVQSVIDRILGPDGDKYIEHLNKLNQQFAGREGKVGYELFEGATTELVKTVFPN